MRNASVERLDSALRGLLGTAAGLDERGSTCLEFRGGVRVFIDSPDDHATAFVHAAVTVDDGTVDSAMLRRAMGLNLFGIAPPGAWLALDKDEATLRLCAPLAPRDPATLDEALTDFLEGLSVAAKRLRAGSEDAAHDRAEHEPLHAGTPFGLRV